MGKIAFIQKFWVWWTGIAKKIGDLQISILLSTFYFVFFIPAAFWLRVFSDPLRLKRPLNSNWTFRKYQPLGMDDARKQF